MEDGKEQVLLDIYSASAGSGKTYTLALKFIDLLISEPKDYEHILAVTFTKKATAEMKERILENLFLLAYEPAKPQPDASVSDAERQEVEHEYQEALKKRKELTEAQMRLFADRGATMTERMLQRNCEKALLYFLNDYSQFNILTIDSFVQKVIRAFAYEANLPAQYGISLDTETIINDAVDKLMVQMKTNNTLKQWILGFVRENIEEGAKWNVEKTIKELCTEFLNNSAVATAQGKALPSMEEMVSFAQTIRKIIKDEKEKITAKLQGFADKFAVCGIDKDINKGGGGFCKAMAGDVDVFKAYDDMMEGKTVFKNFEGFFKKTLYSSPKVGTAKTIYDEMVDFINDCGKDYYTALAIKKNMYAIGVWGMLKKNIDDISQSNGEMQISESNKLLSKLIDGCDIPFVYEKVGSRFKNIMIDEFQDTSRTQWDNFRPLLQNCTANNEKSLIVGDVKQAIYRWRHSDWQLLNKQVEEDCEQTGRTTLATNYRSEARVIDFNNKLFAELGNLYSDYIGQMTGDRETELRDIYDQCAQEIPPSKKEKNGGYVSVQLIDNQDKEQTEKYRTESYMQAVADLHASGYAYRDICFLVRDRKDGAKIMDAVSKAGIPIISSDSLLIDNSPAVKAIVSHMRYICNQNNLLTLVHALDWEDNGTDLSEKIAHMEEYGAKILQLRGMGLTEMTEAIVRMLPKELVEDQYIFIEAFENCVLRYTTKTHVNLSDFLDYYESVCGKLSVEAPDNQDAIQLMTIHKSKGLQFGAVLVPYAEWQISKARQMGYVWDALPSPFDVLPFMPLECSKRLKNTYAKDKYKEELRLRMIDNLNLMYVAFTRAKETLMVWAAPPKSKTTSELGGTVAGYMAEALERLMANGVIDGMQSNAAGTDDDAENNESNAPDCLTYEIGTMPHKAKRTDDKGHKAEGKILKVTRIETNDWSSSERIKIHPESEVKGYQEKHQTTAYGNLMHHIMEHISTTADIDRALTIVQTRGEIDEEKREELKKELEKRLSDEKVARWYDGSQTVLNEVELLQKEEVYRPDRVMIDKESGAVTVVDYKFGAEHEEKYVKQVYNYMHLIKKVGFANVSGYIWYYGTDNIKTV